MSYEHELPAPSGPRHFPEFALNAPAPADSLLAQTTCPHCWESFEPEQALFVSVHPDLVGDQRLGADANRRFLPSRFTSGGDAIDSKGQVCRQLACPRCHLPIPRSVLEAQPYFVSIIGSPGAGKSFFLAAMNWQLRSVLRKYFCIRCTDADPGSNAILIDYENSLFNNDHPDRPTPIANLIRKTDLFGEGYSNVSYGDFTRTLARPFMFDMVPEAGHPAASSPNLTRTLCLYDNAGEHFLAGREDPNSPVTDHMSRSSFLMFLFDPTQDAKFVAEIRIRRPDLAPLLPDRRTRQDSVIAEAAMRISRLNRKGVSSRSKTPLIVVVSKMDLWESMVSPMSSKDYLDYPAASLQNWTLDTRPIRKRSDELRTLMDRLCPAIVTSAESISDNVTYIGVSALGASPTPMPINSWDRSALETVPMGICPRDILPKDAELPFLFGMSQSLKGSIATR